MLTDGRATRPIRVRLHEVHSSRKGPAMPTPFDSPARPRPPAHPRLLGVPQPDALDPTALGADIVDPQSHDTARFLGPEGVPELGLVPDWLAFDRQNDVRPAPLRVIEQHLPRRPSRGDIGGA